MGMCSVGVGVREWGARACALCSRARRCAPRHARAAISYNQTAQAILRLFSGESPDSVDTRWAVLAESMAARVDGLRKSSVANATILLANGSSHVVRCAACLPSQSQLT